MARRDAAVQRQTFPIEPGGPHRVVVAWEWDFSKIEVRFDGEVVGRFDSHPSFMQGATFALPDGSELFVQWVQRGSVGVHAVRNGVPLGGGALDPAAIARGAARWVRVLGALYVLATAALFATDRSAWWTPRSRRPASS